MKLSNFSLMVCLGISLMACGGNGVADREDSQNPTPPPATPIATPVPTPIATPTPDPVVCEAGQVLDEATQTCQPEVVEAQWTDYAAPSCFNIAGRGYVCMQCRTSLPASEDSVEECKDYALSKSITDLIAGINSPKFGKISYVNIDAGVKVSLRDVHDNEIGKAVLVELPRFIQLGQNVGDKFTIYYRYTVASKRLELYDYKRNKVFSKDNVTMLKFGEQAPAQGQNNNDAINAINAALMDAQIAPVQYNGMAINVDANDNIERINPAVECHGVYGQHSFHCE